MTFEINYLIFSIVFLIIGVLVGYFIYSRLNKDKIDQNKDLETLKTEVEDTFTKLLNDLNKKVESYHAKSDQDRGSLTQVLKDIRSIGSGVSTDINTFKNVLVSGGARTQGPWGQMVLEKILEKMEFTEGTEYEKQKSIKTDDGRKIPDCIVHLPNDSGDRRDIIIDAKVSLQAWSEHEESDDPIVKKDALKRHIQSVKNHIRDLASQNYQNLPGIESLDSVIMFSPNEQAIFGLGKDSREILDLAFDKKIVPVGPTMLYFVLKSVADNWSKSKQSKNMQEVIKIANLACSQATEIYHSARKSKENISKTLENLDDVMDQIQDGRGSFLGRIQRMTKLGGLNPKSIPDEALKNIENAEVNTISKTKIKD